MKIGIVRHFKVDIDRPKGELTSKEYDTWRLEYDKAGDIIESEVDLKGIDWHICYASILPRAVNTAEAIFDGKIMEVELLREVDMRFTLEIDDKRGIPEWDIYSIMQWGKNDSSVVETWEDSKERAEKFFNMIEDKHSEGDNILIVSHGTMMVVLEEELRRRTYKGRRVVGPKNGEVYIYQKK